MDQLLMFLKIIVINIVLSGDNSIVIALAAKNLEEKQQNKAMIIGSAGAVILRILLTIVVSYFINTPFIEFMGAILLLWIAVNLLVQEESDQNIQAKPSLWGAVSAIIIADATMSLDNVLAIAGAANGHKIMMIVGLIISVICVIFLSKFILKLMEKYPIIMYIGSAILGWTAGEMTSEDRALNHFIPLESHHVTVSISMALFVIIISKSIIIHKKRRT